MVEGGKATQEKAHMDVLLFLFPWHPVMAVVEEPAAWGRGVLTGQKGCWYVPILCWSFCCRFWFISLISTRPSPNWVDWPWLLHSRQLIKDWLISSLNGWHLAERLGITYVLPPQTSFMLWDLQPVDSIEYCGFTVNFNYYKLWNIVKLLYLKWEFKN